ncbi:hypothetical protein METBIDRAFT_102096 [Metschnikowia bicuspidata var. bicuspidata NRRL YB-4993]|uniref:Uncharacterized protein n=1 Tax=Metschnikowia bicuspidata var. bicuspidata NRRL YB-4993 TaxID=869754 RepID=A0A1A0HH62_9ASCO|nr:hypothetical protein METBIDRAFT_102096 [Metschnikowia bicuspidata var. bicuspidata NRRL YB-4993]OBA23217.1 hypothetical protein METBIDRAFT_102096 [Metschnikowia bicuspidata var. bicuspidata NRRL YB-4993]
MKFTVLLCFCLTTISANIGPMEVNGRKLYPNLQSFASKEALVDSYLWTHLTHTSDDIIALTTAVFLEDSKTILVLAEPKARDLLSTGKELLGITKKSTINMIEIDLGSNIYSVGSDFFPLVTLSAENSSGQAAVEREVSQVYKIKFVPGVNRIFDLAALSVKAVLGVTLSSQRAEKETITCSANSGGKVQLQVSNRMLYFPQARTRKVKYVSKDKEFIEKEWEAVKSSVADEEHLGALFYEHFKLGKNRCVTNTSYFEDVASRNWLEWSEPYRLDV